MAAAWIVRIANRRELERLWISEALLEKAESLSLAVESGPFPLPFDASGDLPAWSQGREQVTERR